VARHDEYGRVSLPIFPYPLCVGLTSNGPLSYEVGLLFGGGDPPRPGFMLIIIGLIMPQICAQRQSPRACRPGAIAASACRTADSGECRSAASAFSVSLRYSVGTVWGRFGTHSGARWRRARSASRTGRSDACHDCGGLLSSRDRTTAVPPGIRWPACS
jgi:hypothetical protein